MDVEYLTGMPLICAVFEKKQLERPHFWASLNAPRREADKSGLPDAAARNLNEPLINSEYIK